MTDAEELELLFEGVQVALGDGLRMRSAREADADRVVAFNEVIHDMPESTGMGVQLGTAVRGLMLGRRPRVGAGDFLLVEDAASGAVVSSLCVIRQRWRYEDVGFDVDQVEFVGTDAAHRRRGLVRRQMDLVHQRSLEPAGGEGRPAGPRTRPATVADVDFLAATYRAAMERYEVTVERDRDHWLADLEGWEPANYHRPALRVIEDDAGRAAGFCSYWASFHNPARAPTRLWVGGLELAPDRDWGTWGPRMADCLHGLAATLAAERGMPPPGISVRLGDAHPFYELSVGRKLDAREGAVWYVRVDVPAFLRLVRPVLRPRGTAAASRSASTARASGLAWRRAGSSRSRPGRRARTRATPGSRS